MRDEELVNGWLPYRMLIDENGAVKFRWFYAGTKRFTEPFFEETISECLSLPQNGTGSFPVTDAATVLNVAELADSVAPAAIIYHISRCGSTLLAQLLACDEQNIVLSEVPLLDEVLRLPFRNEAKKYPPVEELFRALIALLGRRRNGNESRLFIKADSWHVLFHQQLEEWYPGIPSFLMLRSPLEVAASHSVTPAMHTVPGLIEPVLFGLQPEEAVQMTKEVYLEHVLCSYFNAYAEILASGKNAVLLNYHDGAWPMMEQVFDLCGYQPVPEIAGEMKQRSGFHSKKPGSTFTGDGARDASKHTYRAAQQLFDGLQNQSA